MPKLAEAVAVDAADAGLLPVRQMRGSTPLTGVGKVARARPRVIR